MRAGASLWVLGVGVLLTLAPPAQAQLAQPAAPNDPQPFNIPVPVSAGEMGDTQGFNPDVPNAGQFVTLPSLFTFRGENINFQTDAKTEPATFSPLCSFSGTLVLRGGGCKLAFGWYNAVMSGGNPPAANEIYPLIPNNDPVVYPANRAAFAPLATNPPMVNGAPAWALKIFTAADIRNDARYKGGEIGFALIGDSGTACKQTKFSQRALNQVCTACTPMVPWIQTVVYKSTKEDNAYYLGFEDLPSDPTSFKAQNDGDFNDFVFYITGLVCAGGGEPCDTGLKGACAIGKTDCSEAGKPGQCRQVVHETKEECDNVDNNCDGMVDNGDLCPVGKVCENGSCVAACGTGEFRCPLELECEKGFCIDPACKNVPCKDGEACRAGKCVGLCTDVTCPSGQECQLGRCVDLCAGVTCLEKQVCEGGLCLSDCGCRSCGAGKACGKDGKCVDTGCETQTCETGKLCVKGMCKDPCDGAACPGHGACVDGQCQAPAPTIGGSGGGTSEGGTDSLGGFGPLAGTSFIPNDGGGTGGAKSAAGGTGPNNNRPVLKSGETATGCNCRAAGGSSGSSVTWLAAALAALAVARRRRAA